MSTQESLYNNTATPLLAGQSFTARSEPIDHFTTIGTYIACDVSCTVIIQQSWNGNNWYNSSSRNVSLSDGELYLQTFCKNKFFRTIVHNISDSDMSYLNLNTKLSNVAKTELIDVHVTNPNLTVDAVITSPLDTMGNVKVNATNLIDEVNATRRVDYLVVGNWYRVASVGITTGAEWNAIGAIVDGESNPRLGRLFKCLQVGPAVAGGGTCYDVEYTTDISATITNLPTTQPVSGTVSLTDPTSVRIRDAYGDAITTTAGNLMVGINNIYTANPLHTIIDSGTVGLSTSANTVKIDPSNNTVNVSTPITYSARVKTAGNAAVEVNEGGHLLNFFVVNTSATSDAYVKLYDSVATPDPMTDVPFIVADVEHKELYTLNTLQVDTANLKITSKLWVRATTGAADNSTDATGVSLDICFFGTAT